MKIMSTVLLVSILLSGCFFTVKEMTVDPDRGLTHTKEDKNGISQQAKR